MLPQVVNQPRSQTLPPEEKSTGKPGNSDYNSVQRPNKATFSGESPNNGIGSVSIERLTDELYV